MPDIKDRDSMRLTKKGDYALRAVIQVALAEGNSCSINQIAAAGHIPRNFAAKILKQLRDAGLLRSFPGKSGGYRLARPQAEISFREIIEAVEGPIVINRCLDKTSGCNRTSFCRMYDAWKETQDKMLKLLDDIKIAGIIGNDKILEISS
jgi:Rrf2 family iron-sulfur cluster assembly transcriptional regulator